MDLLLGFTPKGLLPMEIFVHPYIPMILPSFSQCGTLFVYPTIRTILPSNKGPLSHPSNNHPSVHSLPTRILHSLPTRIFHSTALEAHALHGVPPVLRACSIPDQLLFTVLGPRHVHEESEAHRLSNRAHPRIPSWSNRGSPPSFDIPRIHPPWLTLELGSDTTCKEAKVRGITSYANLERMIMQIQLTITEISMDK
jgi:hypothetical protein